MSKINRTIDWKHVYHMQWQLRDLLRDKHELLNVYFNARTHHGVWSRTMCEL